MFSLPDDTPEDVQALVERAMSAELVADLAAIGVHVRDSLLMSRQHPDGTVDAGVQITAVVGRLAFGQRVQRPDQHAVDAQFDELAERFVDDEFEKRRRELGE